MPLDQRIIERLNQIVGQNRLMTDPEDLYVYSLEKFFEEPKYPTFDAIIRPNSDSEVKKILRLARAENINVFRRGQAFDKTLRYALFLDETSPPDLDIFEERGFIEQVTERDLLRKLTENPIACYVGFDPTGSSLHVGNLVPIMALAHMQKAGHTPIALVGGGTTLVGDPSGKTEMRQMMSREEIEETRRGLRDNSLDSLISVRAKPFC